MIATLWQRLFHGVCFHSAKPGWSEFLGNDWAQHIMDVAATDDFHAKQGRSTGRLAIRKNGRELSVYLKRHYRLSWFSRLAATLFPWKNWSPALQEAERLQWARAQGFRVPDVIACAEYVGPALRLQSALAIADLIGMVPLHQAIPRASENMDAERFTIWKKKLISELARLIGELHHRRRFHQDLYLCHFFLPSLDVDRWDPTSSRSFRDRLYMIDLHRLTERRWTWQWGRIKDLAQLLYSADVDGITARDRVLFWRLYRSYGNVVRPLRDRNSPAAERRGNVDRSLRDRNSRAEERRGAGRSLQTRLLERLIRLKWKRYQRHNLKRIVKKKKFQENQRREAA